MSEKRKIILHYHLFKNAGTSIDAALKEAFGKDKWVTKEFSNNPARNRNEVKQWISENPKAICFSSHTAHLPPPKIEGIEIFPIIFLRNPIDRIISAYNFERKQEAETFGAVLAKNTTLEGYVKVRLSLPWDRQCKNFQTHRLAMMFPESEGDELKRAKKAIEELPFVGNVNDFKNSIFKFESRINSFFFNNYSFNILKKNTSKGEIILDKNIKSLIYENNSDDLQLQRFINEKN